MKIFADNRLLACGWAGGTLSRHSGNMRPLQARQSVYRELDIPPERILHFQQVHSDTLLHISTPQAAQQCAVQPPQLADGWCLSPFPTGWGVSIVTADCVPLFIWDDSGQHAALAHCGWRGVVKGLPGKTAHALLQQTAPTHLYAWLGPHIQACCFEVQADVAAQFPPDCVQTRHHKLFVDLNTAILQQLAHAGIPSAHIRTPYYCTCGDKENFFSWRRDNQKDLLLSFLYRP